MNNSRMQVTEVIGTGGMHLGYRVKDTVKGIYVGRLYTYLGAATNRAIRENERTKYFKYV